MLGLLIFLGIAIPATELFLLFLIAQSIGFWSTVGIIVVTGVAGALLWRWQGFGILGRFRMAMTAGMVEQMTGSSENKESQKSPLDVLLDGALIFFAGGLLLTPGVITDVVGLLLLIPPTRYLFKLGIYRWAKKRFQLMDFSSTFTMHGANFGGPQQGSESFQDDEDVIEGEILSRSPAESDPE